jgi:FKBP-type peptidyl-prolyl cis-trans isomerase 2
MMPYREFAKQGVEPVSGMTLGLDGVPARVKSVTSGRVVVDFNHPLAGEAVVYTLKVNEVISEDGKKLEAMLPMLEVKGKVSQQGSGFLVEFEKSQPSEKVEAAKRALLSVVPGAAFSIA